MVFESTEYMKQCGYDLMPYGYHDAFYGVDDTHSIRFAPTWRFWYHK